MRIFGKFANLFFVWIAVLALHELAFADRFVNTGSGTINSCDSLTRVGIGVMSPDSLEMYSKLVLGSYENYDGGRLQLNSAYNDSGLTLYMDNYLDDGLYPNLRFFVGNNTDGGDVVIARLSLRTGDFWVSGGLSASSLTITGSEAPDYVFAPGYKVPSLEETERFIRVHRHLPDVPGADEIRNGMEVGDMNLRLLKQVEELTLHAIEQEKRINKLEQELSKQGEKQ